MTKTILIAFVLMASSLGVGYAQEQRTIRGEVVGVVCYTNPIRQEGANVDAQTSCSLSALKAGEPAGIVDQQSGKLYIAISGDGSNISDKLLPNVAKLVDVTGTVQEKEGVNTITVSEVKSVSNAPSQAGTIQNNATEMPSGALGGGAGTPSAAPGMSSGASGANDTLYNVTQSPGIHNATSKEIPGIPNRGTRTGEVYMNEGEPNETSR